MQETLKQLIYDLRKESGSKFLYLPKKISIRDAALITYNHFFNKEKSDFILINLITEELVNIGILHKDFYKYYKYDFDNFSINDMYLKTSDGATFCRGTSTDYSESFAKALGEVLERTSIRYIDKKNIIYANNIEIKKVGLSFDIKNMPQATKAQKDKYPNFNYNDKDIFAWTKVLNLKDNKDYLVPSQCIFTSGNLINKEKNLVGNSTHGAGAGHTEKDSIRSGLFEVVHRHEFFKSWYSKTSPDILDVDTIEDKKIKEIILDMEARGFKVNLLDYSASAEVPSFICMLERFGGLYCGGSTSYTAVGAIERSICEAFSTYAWKMQISQRGGNNVTKDFIESTKEDFSDENLTGYNRIFLFGNSFFVNNFDKFFLLGKVTSYTDQYDKDRNSFDISAYSTEKFGDVFVYKVDKNILKDYEYFVSKVFIPNSYFFALDEIFSKPILDGVLPKFTRTNPFP